MVEFREKLKVLNDKIEVVRDGVAALLVELDSEASQEAKDQAANLKAQFLDYHNTHNKKGDKKE